MHGAAADRAAAAAGANGSRPAGNLYLSVLLRPRGPAREGRRCGRCWPASRWPRRAAPHCCPMPGADAEMAERRAARRAQAGRHPGRCAADTAGAARLAGDRLRRQSRAPRRTCPGRATACARPSVAEPPPPRTWRERLLAAAGALATVRALDGFAPVRAAWLARAQPVGTAITLRSVARMLGGTLRRAWRTTAACCCATDGRVDAFATGEILPQADAED